MIEPLSREEEDDYQRGLQAEALLGSSTFRDLSEDFERSCSRVFFNSPQGDNAEIVTPDLLRARTTYIGYRAFCDHLMDLITHKQELDAVQEQRAKATETSST